MSPISIHNFSNRNSHVKFILTIYINNYIPLLANNSHFSIKNSHFNINNSNVTNINSQFILIIHISTLAIHMSLKSIPIYI